MTRLLVAGQLAQPPTFALRSSTPIARRGGPPRMRVVYPLLDVACRATGQA